jgi:hypothetical protein
VGTLPFILKFVLVAKMLHHGAIFLLEENVRKNYVPHVALMASRCVIPQGLKVVIQGKCTAWRQNMT